MSGQTPAPGDFEEQRMRMVATQIEARGVTAETVLEAMRSVPRHVFVPPEYHARAYDDAPLPIGHGQTISQPFIVAYMTEALELQSTDRVLEIGTGSGYQTAVLAEIAQEVYTIEILEPLATAAAETLQELEYTNIRGRHGNGYAGWPEVAPFDKIIVTAAPPEVPEALVAQLAVGGLMVVPVGEVDQMMTFVRRTETGVVSRETLPVRFVPMVEAPSSAP
jgi:protein-L-isoaspartate(D-aspartate) O-methyltransferase